jgi:hypothetical protein
LSVSLFESVLKTLKLIPPERSDAAEIGCRGNLANLVFARAC